MKYKYSESAGYYGRGGWICYDNRGVAWKVFGYEQQAIDYCARFGGAK